MRSRPSLGVIVIAFVITAVGITAVLGAIMLMANRARSSASETVARQTRHLMLYESTRAGALTETMHLAGYVLLQDERSITEIRTARTDVDSALAELRDTTSDARKLERIDAMAAEHTQLVNGFEHALLLAQQGDVEGVLELGNDGLSSDAVAFLADLDTAVQEARIDVLRAQDDAKGKETRADAATLAIVAAWCVLVVGAAASLRFAVLGPLNDLSRTARHITLGDTSARAAETGAREVALLGRDINHMAEALLTRTEELAAHSAELEEANTRLAALLESERERARRDPLTGSLNHGALAEELRILLSQPLDGTTAYVAMVDVNGLKDINDAFGHQTGDEALRRVARALAQDGATVGRYGGDEFVALLSPCSETQANAYRLSAERAMAESGFKDDHTGASVTVSASMGLAAYPTEGTRIEEILARADSAMYAAKRQRPVAAGDGTRNAIDDELAARMIGELVPLMASAGTLDEKLGLIAQRLSQGTGYAGVTFDVAEQGSDGVTDRNTTLGTNAYVEADQSLLDEWRQEQRTTYNHPISDVMREHMRPVIIDDLSTTPYVTEEQRTLLKAASIRSAIVVPLVWQGEWIGSMGVGSHELAAFVPRDARFLSTVAGHASAIIQSERMVEELRRASDQLAASHGDTVMLLAASVEAHDSTTGRHLVRVQELTRALALEMGVDQETADAMATASVLHDIGKVRVPDSILKSPDKLSENEWLTMKQHTVWGAEFLTSHSGFELAAEIARAHHERWDGSGYPHGVVADAIPVSAQVVSVADAFDAMTSDRPYRLGRSHRSAIREIFTHSGTQFSPAVVAALLRVYRRGGLEAGEAVEDAAA